MPTVTSTHTPNRRDALRFSAAALAAGITSPATASPATPSGLVLFPGIPADMDHPGDMALLRWSMIANGTKDPVIRRRALAEASQEALRLASLETPGGADAELIAAHAAFMASHGRLYPSDGRMTTGMTDAESNAETDRWYAAMDRVAELPASTPEGRRAKIEVAHAALDSTAYSNGNGLEREEQCALDVLASLLGSAA